MVDWFVGHYVRRCRDLRPVPYLFSTSLGLGLRVLRSVLLKEIDFDVL